MTIFSNKKLWQKILIVFLVIILFNIILAKPVHAASADVLLKPITGMFVGISDSLEGVMQKIVLGVDESLIHIEDGKADFWANFIVIGLFVLGTAVAIIAAIPSGRLFSSSMGCICVHSSCIYCYIFWCLHCCWANCYKYSKTNDRIRV